jgi:PilZ domain
MNEHRIATRRRVLKSGKIEFGGGAIDCTIRNLSDTGAALDVTSPVGIPAEFNLVVNGTPRPCRVVWRKEKRIGITFGKQP